MVRSLVWPNHPSAPSDAQPEQRVYIREAAAILNRRMGTLRKWENMGVLPKELLPKRGKRGWRYWTPVQLAGIRKWIRDTNRYSGTALPNYNPTEKELDAVIKKLRRRKHRTIEKERPNPRTNPRQAKKLGNPDTKSRAKAESAQKRANEQTETVDSDGWPRNAAGKPMVRITMTASELVPTGQYANVAVGPAQITMFVDPDDAEILTEHQRTNLAKALLDTAEIVEADVIAVLRNLVLESLQEQVASGNSGETSS